MTNARTIIIRVDANSDIGAGHLMRCICLADALVNIGFDVRFVVASLSMPEFLTRFFVEYLSDCIVASPQDSEQTLKIIAQSGAAAIVLDGYAFDESYRQKMQSQCAVICFDDESGSEPITADWLINASPCSHTMGYQQRAPSAKLLLGETYIMLADSYLSQVQSLLAANAKRERLLVCFGGADTDQNTLPFLHLLADANVVSPDCVDVVCGAMVKDWQSVEAFCLKAGYQFYVDHRDMPSLMKRSAVAVVAAGSMLYELAYMGVPALAVIVADNQRPNAEFFQDHGVAHCIDAERYNNQSSLLMAVGMQLKQLWGDMRRRHAMSLKGLRLCDGGGASRIAGMLADAYL
ncbi:UDP-2,4-diacetamido-2,4,6-trideoxy-beta-L-altropyranose hydrolase [bacterium]|nr:UDP-2,4-diacetamido-2,4,6-trideoxy-beta-L-altropyranose hydrolase [bacterium]